MRVEGLIFAGVGSADHDGVARFLADALAVDVEVFGTDGHRFELLDRTF